MFVGESARSMFERSAEHWADYRSGEEDSHILEHWTLHHGGIGEPRFRFQVINFCRDALSRQVGESTRIDLRGNCLNSKSGYNRSGISRLLLKPDEEQSDETHVLSRRMEMTEREGLEKMTQNVFERAKAFKKRSLEEDNPKRKKKNQRRLNYKVLVKTGVCRMEK